MRTDQSLRHAELALLNAPFDTGGWQSAPLGDPRFHGATNWPSAPRRTLFDEGGPLQLSGLALEFSDHSENQSFQQGLKRLLASDGHHGPVVREARVGRREAGRGARWRLFIAACRIGHTDSVSTRIWQ